MLKWSFGPILISLVGLTSTAVAQAPVPNNAATHCTRGTNPYQDLKDALNSITSDLQDGAESLSDGTHKHSQHLGHRLQKEWTRFLTAAKKVQRDVPADLDQGVKSAADALIKRSPAMRNPADLRALAKRTDDLSMTMTCPQ